MKGPAFVTEKAHLTKDPKDFPVEHSVIGRVGYPSYFFPSKRIAERKFLFIPLKFISSSHDAQAGSTIRAAINSIYYM